MIRPRRTGTGMRLLRAAVFTAVCVLLSAAGHAMAVGHPVALWKLLAAWPAVFAVVAPLAGRERRLPGITAGLAVGQIGLHLLFSVGEMCGRNTAATHADGVRALAERLLCAGDAARLTPHLAEQVVRQAGIAPAHIGTASAASATDMPGMPGMPGIPTLTGAGASYSLSMLIGHLLAALAAGWLLRRGDMALSRLAELSASAIRRALVLVRVLLAGAPGDQHGTAPRPGRVSGHGYEPGPPRTALLRHSMARRGPPALTLAA